MVCRIRRNLSYPELQLYKLYQENKCHRWQMGVPTYYLANSYPENSKKMKEIEPGGGMYH